MTIRPERLPEALARALAARGYRELTPVQRAVLTAAPDADLLVSAPTGSGKTVAFGLAAAEPLIAALAGGAGGPLVLVVTPTRELAMQVRGELAWLMAGIGARVVCCIGGTDPSAEREMLATRLEIVVGSPGRLRDHLARRALPSARIGCVILDEADDMLDMGFRADLEAILDILPPVRRTLMFSATVTPAVETLARRFQRDALRIDLAREDGSVAIQGILAAAAEREAVIVNLLRFHEASGAMIFCGRRALAAQLAARLGSRGFKAVALSGAFGQRERTAAMAAMRSGRARVCVATDLAARGLDLPGLDLVIHADLPASPELLLHRSGRTGRQSRIGAVVLLARRGERARAEELARAAGVELAWAPPPGRAQVIARDLERMVADPVLSPPEGPVETAVVKGLMASHGPDRLAAAVGRLWSDGRPAPEDLKAALPDGVWLAIELEIGRRRDVKRALAIICRLGRVERADIGRVRLLAREAQFELQPEAAARYLAAVTGRVNVRRLDEPSRIVGE